MKLSVFEHADYRHMKGDGVCNRGKTVCTYSMADDVDDFEHRARVKRVEVLVGDVGGICMTSWTEARIIKSRHCDKVYGRAKSNPALWSQKAD